MIKYGSLTDWSAICHTVLSFIQNEMLRDTNLEGFTSVKIAEETRLNVHQVAAALTIIRPFGYFWSNTAGTFGSSYGTQSITIGNTECFQEILRYTGMDSLILAFEIQLALDKQRLKTRGEKMMSKEIIFIAMPMDPALDDVLDAIETVALDLGMNALRIDKQESNEKISDRIINAINNSDYMIADLTNSRPNVFFEAGFALGLGKIPIFIAKQGTALEFDIHDYPVIFFEKLVHLKTALKKRLTEIRAKHGENKPALVPIQLQDVLVTKSYGEGDKKALLTDWFRKQKGSEHLINYDKVDKELEFSSGDTKRLIEEIASSLHYITEQKGDLVIRLVYRSPRVSRNRSYLDSF